MKQKSLIPFLVVSLILIAGCTTNTTNQTEQNTTEPKTIKTASFNIQIFGQTKIENLEVMKIRGSM